MQIKRLQKQQLLNLTLNVLIVILCLAPAVYVGFLGLERPYDAVPDQDLLWVSEALRIARGVSPSYADHPGAFWTIVFRINIKLLRVFSGIAVVDFRERITPEGVNVLIKLSRIQNSLFVGISGYLLFLASLKLGINKMFSASIGIIFSFSTGVLLAVGQIRHEIPSLNFLILSFLAFAFASAAKLRNERLRLVLVLLAIVLFFASAYSKSQILLLAPLYFLGLLVVSWNRLRGVCENALLSNSGLGNYRSFLNCIFIAFSFWALGSFPGLKPLNAFAWVFINMGLAFFASLGVHRPLTVKSFYRSLLLVGFIEILLFRCLLPHWWTTGVARFPLWLSQYGAPLKSAPDNLLSLFGTGVSFYVSNFSDWQFVGIASFVALVVASSILIILSLCRLPFISAYLGPLALAVSWLYIGLLMCAMSFRLADRYQIYILAPLLLTAAFSINRLMRFDGNLVDRVGKLVFSLPAALIVSLALHKSVLNIGQLHAFASASQPRDVLCIGHHMDKTMILTSAGSCSNFQDAALDKQRFDFWSGPF